MIESERVWALYLAAKRQLQARLSKMPFRWRAIVIICPTIEHILLHRAEARMLAGGVCEINRDRLIVDVLAEEELKIVAEIL